MAPSRIGAVQVRVSPRTPRPGTGGAMRRPPRLVDLPSAGEIEAYYLSDQSLKPARRRVVQKYVREHYVDGGTREKFLAQRRRIELAIAAAFDTD